MMGIALTGPRPGRLPGKPGRDRPFSARIDPVDRIPGPLGLMLSSLTTRKTYAAVGTFMAVFVLQVIAGIFQRYDPNWALLGRGTYWSIATTFCSTSIAGRHQHSVASRRSRCDDRPAVLAGVRSGKAQGVGK